MNSRMGHTKVISYQSPGGGTISLTNAQILTLEKAAVWPKDSTGREYCSVSHGLHYGSPTYSDAELRALIG